MPDYFSATPLSNKELLARLKERLDASNQHETLLSDLRTHIEELNKIIEFFQVEEYTSVSIIIQKDRLITRWKHNFYAVAWTAFASLASLTYLLLHK